MILTKKHILPAWDDLLPSKSIEKPHINEQIEEKVKNKIWDEVRNQVWGQIRDQIEDKLWHLVVTQS